MLTVDGWQLAVRRSVAFASAHFREPFRTTANRQPPAVNHCLS